MELLEPDGRGIRLTDAGHALVLRADDLVQYESRDRKTARKY